MATLFTATVAVSSHHRFISSSRASKQNPLIHLVSSQLQPLSVTKQPLQQMKDLVASPLTRRFGIGAAFSLAGVLAFGIVSEQMKTGLDIYQENPNTRDIEKQEEIVLPNGIRYYDLQVGHGSTPSSGHLVVINVKGQVYRTKQVFVDTFESKETKPLAMVMESRPYSKGLCEGIEYILSSMKPGGKRRVIIPPSLGFGEKSVEFGHDLQIPKSATLEYILQEIMVSVLDSHYLAITAIVTVGYQFIFFVITALFKIDKVTDFAGSTNFVILALLTLVLKSTWYFRQIVLTSLVVVWGLRLALFLLMRILQWGEDRRFDEMRGNLVRLIVFWALQAVWVWTVSLPVTFVNGSDDSRSLTPSDVIGWTMWLIGFLIEAAADQQKLSFKNSSENRGKWCDVGVWKYSRHPNYFGEILLWWGIFVSASSVLEGAEYLVIIGPVFLTTLLLFVSGIPLLEVSADRKYGHLGAYRFYKKTTSPLVLFPRGVYGKLPGWCKTVFLFEFPFYSRSLNQEVAVASD